MENASKALIIAGAILISIVLIGVGVLIIGNAQGIFGQGNIQMSQMDIQAFNEPFMPFDGRQSASNIKTLLQKIATHNATYAGDTEKIITVNSKSLTSSNVSATKNKVGVAETYTVTMEYSDVLPGLVHNIVIKNSAGNELEVN